jgi:hypothetical protein
MSAEAHFLFQNHQVQISDEQRREKDVGPIYKLTTFRKVGPGAAVGTLQIGHPCIQTPS